MICTFFCVTFSQNSPPVGLFTQNSKSVMFLISHLLCFNQNMCQIHLKIIISAQGSSEDSIGSVLFVLPSSRLFPVIYGTKCLKFTKEQIYVCKL